jgi:hypothetical protein
MGNLAAASYGRTHIGGRFTLTYSPEQQIEQAKRMVVQHDQALSTAKAEVKGLKRRQSGGDEHPALPHQLYAAEKWLGACEARLKSAQNRLKKLEVAHAKQA